MLGRSSRGILLVEASGWVLASTEGYLSYPDVHDDSVVFTAEDDLRDVMGEGLISTRLFLVGRLSGDRGQVHLPDLTGSRSSD